jgi:FAM163 family
VAIAENLPTWAIVVIVFGILLILILIVVLFCCLCRIGFWCCAAANSDDDDRKKKVANNGWFGRRRLETSSSKRPQILYRYPDDDAATIVAGGGDGIATSGSGYVPRALRLTNDRPKTVRVVEDVNFNDDGRPVFVVDGARSSIIGKSTHPGFTCRARLELLFGNFVWKISGYMVSESYRKITQTITYFLKLQTHSCNNVVEP